MTKYIAVLAALVLVPSLAFASVDLSLVGGAVAVQQGRSYVEPGYSAVSTVDGDITGLVSVDEVNTEVPGRYFIGYVVTDSALDTGFAVRQVTVSGGGAGQLFCSGPTAPGWTTGVANGGCGGAGTFVAQGAQYFLNGVTSTCLFFSGCMIPR